MFSESFSKFTNAEEGISVGLIYCIKSLKYGTCKVLKVKVYKSGALPNVHSYIRLFRNACNLSDYVIKCQNWVTLSLNPFLKTPFAYCAFHLWYVFLLTIL